MWDKVAASLGLHKGGRHRLGRGTYSTSRDIITEQTWLMRNGYSAKVKTWPHQTLWDLNLNSWHASTSKCERKTAKKEFNCKRKLNGRTRFKERRIPLRNSYEPVSDRIQGMWLATKCNDLGIRNFEFSNWNVPTPIQCVNEWARFIEWMSEHQIYYGGIFIRARMQLCVSKRNHVRPSISQAFARWYFRGTLGFSSLHYQQEHVPVYSYLPSLNRSSSLLVSSTLPRRPNVDCRSARPGTSLPAMEAPPPTPIPTAPPTPSVLTAILEAAAAWALLEAAFFGLKSLLWDCVKSGLLDMAVTWPYISTGSAFSLVQVGKGDQDQSELN